VAKIIGPSFRVASSFRGCRFPDVLR
jgi:hypothetical protein